MKRIAWVDVLKFLGILSIYVAHFLELGGNSHKFIFAYGVEVFFFASGLFALTHSSASVWSLALKRFKDIMVPYYFFSFATLLVLAIRDNYSISQVLPMLKPIFTGIRNQTPAPTLWFLPCLFVLSCFYETALRLLKKDWLLLLLGLTTYGVMAAFFDPVMNPRLFFNIDSALYYFFFYALGAFVFSHKEKLFRRDTLLQKVCMTLAVCFVLAVAACMYFGKMITIYLVLKVVPGFVLYYPLLISTVLTAFLVLLAKLLSGIELFGRIGRKTLHLCGNELIIKTIFPEFCYLFGLTIQINNPLAVYLYSFVLILIVYYILTPFEEKILNFFLRKKPYG